jgi:hypothetical protein
MDLIIAFVVTAFFIIYAVARLLSVCLDIYNKWPRRGHRRALPPNAPENPSKQSASGP